MRQISKIFALALMAVFFTGNLYAYVVTSGWNVDLSTLGGATYNNIQNITLTGSSKTNQVLTGTGSIPGTYTLVNGDSFTESTILQQLSFTDPDGIVTNIAGLYFYASGLTGVVNSVNNDSNSPNPADWEFEYSFNGYTSMGVYYYTGAVNVNNALAFNTALATEIATFDLFSGTGISPDNFVGGGASFSGKTDLIVSFSSADTGIFSDKNNVDFASLIGTEFQPYGTFGLTNWILPNDVAYTPGDNFFNATIRHSGDFNVVATPEPGTLLLLGAGLLGLGAVARRRKN